MVTPRDGRLKGHTSKISCAVHQGQALEAEVLDTPEMSGLGVVCCLPFGQELHFRSEVEGSAVGCGGMTHGGMPDFGWIGSSV